MPGIALLRATAVSLPMLLLAASLTAQSSATDSQPVDIVQAPEAAQAPGVQTASRAAPAISAPSGSKVRIVRLSEVKGVVQMDRANGRGFEAAITNLPVIESSRLQTGDGVAEVEFEDNSTLRVGPDSIVEFPLLERLPGGTTVSSVHLVKGMAYVSLMKTAGNEFNLLFGQQNLRLPTGSHIRLELNETEAKLAVLDGGVHVESPSGVMDVSRKKTVTFEMADGSQPQVAKDVASNSFDEWDRNAVAYHARTASMSMLSGSPYAYGSNDMAYYGAFSDAGGCGSMWRPYFASAAWEPYSNGAWAWYQGAGYSFVSPYQWGWTPYHSGSWSYCQGSGWGWMPGNNWNGLNNTAALTGLKGPTRGPTVPVHAPKAGEPTLLAAGLKPATRSGISESGSFVFRKDSAGLGIPREGLGRLDKFSEHVMQKGSVATPVYIQAPTSFRSGGHGTAQGGVATIHRGSSSSSGGGSFQGGNSNPGSRSSNVSSMSTSSSSSSHSSAGSGGGGGSHH